MDIINIVLGFLEGFALILSPCILPILPIILSGSLEGSRKRPYGIILGFVLTFALFTFFARSLVLYTGIHLEILRYVSYGLLILLGVIMLSTYLTDKFTLIFSRLSTVGSSFDSTANHSDGFVSGIILGGLVGIIWTPCAGPILAAVIVQTVLQKTTFNSFLVILFFGIGAGVPMLLIALFGRRLMAKFAFFKTHALLFRKILGAIIIASVLAMIYGEGLPSASATPVTASSDQTLQLLNGVTPYPAPKIAGISGWINSKPLTLDELKGKVVLIDFWTYSCINCIRTLPYLKDWYQKYHDQGLVIIGVHTPEFEFEKNFNNIKSAVEKFGILYPVASDDHFVTWQNFHNQYWPAHYLIDKNGDVVYEHFGEGDYDVTENNIRYLLGVNKSIPASTLPLEATGSMEQTPETYLGYARADNFASRESMVKDQASAYSFPNALVKDQWALRGSWIVGPDKIISASAGATIKLHFHAQKVYIVMGSSTNQPIPVKILLNGKEAITEKGEDVSSGEVMVKDHRLYEVIALSDAENGMLFVVSEKPGLEVFTFTFG